jgi:cytoskeletal protein CcmA (bactofilin family)
LIVDGVVNGDLIAAGGTILLTGEVTQDVRIAGGNINIDGTIGRNLTVGGGNVDIASTAQIGGSVLAGAGTLNLGAPVAGNVLAGVGQLTVSNAIAGDLETGVGQLSLTSNAQVGGDLSYWSEEDASIASNAAVAGQVQKHRSGVSQKNFEEVGMDFSQARRQFSQVAGFVGSLSFLIVAFLLAHFYPKFSQNTVTTLKSNPWKSLLVGILAVIATPIIVVLLMITVIGIPLGLMLLAVYFIYLYLAKFAVVLWAGMELAKRVSKKVSIYWSLILGVAVYYVVTLIPNLGGLIKLFVFLFGLGAMLIACKNFYFEEKKKGLV